MKDKEGRGERERGKLLFLFFFTVLFLEFLGKFSSVIIENFEVHDKYSHSLHVLKKVCVGNHVF